MCFSDANSAGPTNVAAKIKKSLDANGMSPNSSMDVFNPTWATRLSTVGAQQLSRPVGSQMPAIKGVQI